MCCTYIKETFPRYKAKINILKAFIETSELFSLLFLVKMIAYICCPVWEHFTYKGTSPWPMKGCQLSASAPRLRPSSSDGSFSFHTRYDTWLRFSGSHSKDRHVYSLPTTSQVCIGTFWIQKKQSRFEHKQCTINESSLFKEFEYFFRQCIYLSSVLCVPWKKNCKSYLL